MFLGHENLVAYAVFREVVLRARMRMEGLPGGKHPSIRKSAVRRGGTPHSQSTPRDGVDIMW